MDIPIYYDPMIAKLVTWGKDRKEAIDRMKRAIREYEITGVETTLSFCLFVLEHEVFVTGDFDTHFIKKYYTPEKLQQVVNDELEIASIVGASWLSASGKATSSQETTTRSSSWKRNRTLD
jgi:acetyl/propionyl-CoA carboxylase alpha subunit